jgi:hypothetical protein
VTRAIASVWFRILSLTLSSVVNPNHIVISDDSARRYVGIGAHLWGPGYGRVL